jgi:hypothetical protein
MLVVVLAATTFVFTVKVPVVAPAAMTIFDGFGAAVVLLLVTGIERPPAGAGPARVIVPVAVPTPPTTLVGVSVYALIGRVTDNVAVRATVSSVAVIVDVIVAPTPCDVAVKVAVAEPAATSTEAGTVTLTFELVKATVSPPAGALAFNVTVPTELARPPMTVVGASATDARIGSLVSVAVVFTVSRVAVIVDVTLAVVLFSVAETGNVAEFWPAGIVTDAGTTPVPVAARVTTSATADVALSLMVTVPTDVVRVPTIVAGLRVTVPRIGRTVRVLA